MASKGQLVIRFMGDIRDLNRSSDAAEKRVTRFQRAMGKANKAANVALVAGGVAAVKFGTDSVKAYAEAETQQAKLTNAYKKFPKLADMPINKLKELNETLAKKTKFDDDATASGQAVLAQFGLTGKQVAKLTPLLQDYAAKTGKDLPTAAKDLGKSIMGQGRAMKNIGLDFQDTGSKTGNLTQLMDGLNAKVGGFAKNEGATAAGKAEILKNQFGELQETVGGALMPTLQKFVDVMLRVVGWIDRNRTATMLIVGAFAAFVIGLKLAIVSMQIYTVVSKLMATTTLGTRIQLAALTVQQKLSTAATVVWSNVTKVAAVVARGMGLALRFMMGPIGLVITAIALLVAGLVWFFTKTKIGQAIVRNVWSGIKSAIKGVSDWWTQTAWPAIRGALKAMGEWFQMVGRVVRRVWRAMGEALGSTWRWIRKNVIDRFVNSIRFWVAVVRIAMRGVRIMWAAMGAALGRVWGWIKKNVIDRFKLGLLVLRVAFRMAKDKIGSIFGNLKERLGSIGTWIRKNVFGRIKSALGNMRDAFRTAKDKIGDIWSHLKSLAAKPVNFIIKTVWNDGLRKVLNAIPGVKLDEIDPIKFAKGGHYGAGAVTGGIRGRDSVPAMYMPGEHVWTEKEVRAVGGQKVMYGMRKAALDGRLEFAKGGALSASSIAKAQAFANQQRGKPYGWGAVGPSSYDCSGFMSALTNVIRGRAPHSRVGSTASFPWGGFEKGPGQFTIGSSKNFSGGIGHMAGNLAGLGVESRGGQGVILGSGAMSPSRFAGQWHLGSSGGKYGSGSGNWWDNLTSIVGAIKKLPGQIREMMSSGSWIGGFLKKMVVAVSKNVAKFINDKIPNGIPFVGDNPIKPLQLASGGVVKHRPGGVLANIGEGRRDEAVIPLGRGGGAPAQSVVYVPREGELGKMLLQILRKEIRAAGGDPVIVLGRR